MSTSISGDPAPAPAPALAPVVPAGFLPEQVGVTQSPRPRDIRHARSSAEFNLRELMTLQRRGFRTNEKDMERRLRLQAEAVLSDLRALRREVTIRAKEAEAHRWRKWILGGML